MSPSTYTKENLPEASPQASEVVVEEHRKRCKPIPLTSTSSRLFTPFKAVGYICNHVPFAIQALGQSFYITTSTGNSFQVFDVESLNISLVGRSLELPISALSVRKDVTFAACGNQIVVFKRTEPIRTLTSDLPGDINYLEVFGEHVMALTEDNVFQLWDIKGGELYTDIRFSVENFRVTCVLHPAAHLNKVVFGSGQGTLQVWNIKTRKLLYTFKSFGSPVTCLAQSPIVDVLGVGLLDGTILLLNFKLDKVLFSFKQQDKVTSITFRTDGHHQMATASMGGDIAIWDLDTRKLFHVLQNAHAGNIPSLQFLNNQNLLISSGSDNTLKQWLFDDQDDLPRMYKSRSGHYAPPTQVRYYYGGTLMSAGQDRTVRQFSLFKDSRSKELSQGHLAKKAKDYAVEVATLRLPPVIHLSVHNAQQHRWANMLTVHQGQHFVSTWSVLNGALGEHVLTLPGGSLPKVSGISHCGHFGLVGCSDGSVHCFNLQSGLWRRSTNAHSRPITSILPDRSNRSFTTTSLDGQIKVIDFNSFKEIASIDVGVPVSHAVSHHDTSLVAVAGDDSIIRIVDIETNKVVRVFDGHSHRITDLAFSKDGRWLVSSSLDGTVRTWDVPSSHLIDAFRVDSVVTSLTFSPFGDFIATSHADHVGIYVWSNRSFYADVSLSALNKDFCPKLISLPKIRPDSGDTDDSDSESEEPSSDSPAELDLFRDPDQLTAEMVTLSRAPWSKWQKLLNLATIKQRNKPIAPPKKPEKAPFFLATTQGVNPKFIAPVKVSKSNQDENNSHLLTLSDNIETELIQIMDQAVASKNIDQLLECMESLMPPQVEIEVGLLSVRDNFRQFKLFLDALTLLLERGVGFEMAHAYLHTFLKSHGELIANNPDVFYDPLSKLQSVHTPQWQRLAHLFHYTTSLMDFVRSK